MKIYTPTQRQIALGMVLQYDSESQALGKSKYFTIGQRIVINQERAALMSGNDYTQSVSMEDKIQFVINQIITTKWSPEKPIPYV